MTEPHLPAELTLDDTRWQQLVDLTAGAAALCYQCGVCTAVCPWGLVRSETITVRAFLRHAQLGLELPHESLWLCTTCGQCQLDCPRQIQIPEVLRGLRQLAWEDRRIPAGLPSLLWSLHWNNNPWTQPPSHRARWAQALDLPLYHADTHEILMYVGCTASYDRRAGLVAQALIELLRSADLPFGYLGEAEPCCGEAALSVGHLPFFHDLSRSACALFLEHGVERLVTLSPHCYDVFKNHYPPMAPFEPQHYTHLLANLLETGQLSFSRRLERQVTFHDPCFLARHNQETAAPRQVLERIPGLALVEMEDSKENTLCCGGGGGRMWLETAAGERFSDLRVAQARAAGAEILVTACPFCITCLEDSLKAQGIGDLAVMDVAELAALALK